MLSECAEKQGEERENMKKITKILSVLLSAVMLMSALCVSASAASIEDTAKAIDSGKKVSFTPDANTKKDYKITLSEKGTLKLNITSKTKMTFVQLLDSNGNQIDFDSKNGNVTTGSCGATFGGYAWLEWNSALEKFSGKISYKSLSKGTYYVRIWKDYGRANGKTSVSFTYPQSTDNEETGTISALSVTLKKGETLQFGAVIEGEGTVEWTSSKKSVASVNSDGKITAKSKGSATIQAKLGSSSVKININVTE